MSQWLFKTIGCKAQWRRGPASRRLTSRTRLSPANMPSRANVRRVRPGADFPCRRWVGDDRGARGRRHAVRQLASALAELSVLRRMAGLVGRSPTCRAQRVGNDQHIDAFLKQSAGEGWLSLMPSPTMATIWPAALRARINSSLKAGVHSASMSSGNASSRTACSAAARRSLVAMASSTPEFRIRSRICRASGFSRSSSTKGGGWCPIYLTYDAHLAVGRRRAMDRDVALSDGRADALASNLHHILYLE